MRPAGPDGEEEKRISSKGDSARMPDRISNQHGGFIMAITVNTNIASLNAQRNLSGSGQLLSQSLQRLSSGLRLNSAKDDAAGLAISTRMGAQVRGLNQAARNANDGISLAQTAEGALGEITNNLQRIRELAVQSANASNSQSDRAALQAEVAQRVAEIDRVAAQTDFNGKKLLDGSFSAQRFQVGANQGQTISITSISSARTTALGASYSATTTSGAVNAVATGGGNVTINGVSIVASVSDGVSTAAADASAKAKATAINATSGHGVTATANATAVGGTANVGADLTGTITINGVTTASFSTSAGDTAQNRANTVAAINAISAATGVIATNTGDNATGVTLAAADGRNIVHSFNTLTAAATGVGTAATTYGTLTLTSNGNSGITIGGTAVAVIGSPSSVSATQTGTAVSAIDISSADGADTAILSIDAAINTINTSRGDLGAIQNRFESIIANLMNVAENLSAAQARIMDADFAVETANLTKSQILQQAGLAMLAQANTVPQAALTLLQG
jgi:flagellin